MRKTIRPAVESGPNAQHQWLDLEGISTVEVTSEDPNFPIESAFAGEGRGWRAADGAKHCAVIDTPSRTLSVQSCPAWIYWNAGGEGYYRTSWTAEQLEAFSLGDLTAAERLALAQDLREELRAQKSGREAERAVLTRLAADHEPEVAAAAKAALK